MKVEGIEIELVKKDETDIELRIKSISGLVVNASEMALLVKFLRLAGVVG